MTATTPWIESPRWDGFWTMSGIWLIVPLAILGLAEQALQIALAVSLVGLWLAHRVGTTYLSFTHAAYFDLIRAQRSRFVWVPLATFGFFFLFFFDPLNWIPLSPIDKGKIGLSAYFFINSIHFAFQHYGVLSIYRARAKQPLSKEAKYLEKSFCVAVVGVIITVGLILKGSAVLDSTMFESAWRSGVSQDILFYVAPIGSAVAVILSALLLKLEFANDNPSWPKAAYIVSVGIQGVLVFYMDPIPFFLLWAVQHWLVSIGFTVRMAPALSRDAPLPAMKYAWYRFWSRVNGHRWSALLALVAISALMAPLFVGATNPEKIQLVGSVFAEHAWLAKLFLTLSVGSAFVHLNMDRAVFRFSNEAVRKISLPLLFR